MTTRYGLKLVTAPAGEPITTTEARKHVRIGETVITWDTILGNLVVAARQYAENYTDRKFITQTWDLFLDCFPSSREPIYIPFGQCQSAVVTYTDADGATQTWSASEYTLSDSREPAIIRPNLGETYPTPKATPDAVKVRFVCGYGAASAVPRELKAAMLLLVDSWFRNTSAEIVGTSTTTLKVGVDSILQNYRLGDEFTKYGIELRVA